MNQIYTVGEGSQNMDTRFLSISEGENVTTVTFDRPEKRNALTVEGVRELDAYLSDSSQEPDNGIVFTGTGPVTCAGADTDIVGGSDEKKKGQLLEALNGAYETLQTYPRPTVMAANGAAIGAGFQLAATCDFTIAGKETTLSKPEVEYGVFSGYSTAALQDSVGSNVAREIALKGTPIKPQQAREWGIVSEVVPEEDVESRARELCEDLSRYDKTAYEKTKQALVFEGSPGDFERYP